MDLFSFVLGLPVAPVRGLLAIARVIQQEAESELYDPSRVRRQLEQIEAAEASDEMSGQEARQKQEEVVGRLVNQ